MDWPVGDVRMPSQLDQTAVSADNSKLPTPHPYPASAATDGQSPCNTASAAAHKNVFDIMMRERELMNNSVHSDTTLAQPLSPVPKENPVDTSSSPPKLQEACVTQDDEENFTDQTNTAIEDIKPSPKRKWRKRPRGKCLLKSVSPSASPAKLGAKAILHKALKHSPRKLTITDFFTKENKTRRIIKRKGKSKRLVHLKRRRRAVSLPEVDKSTEHSEVVDVMENGHVSDTDMNEHVDGTVLHNNAASGDLCEDLGIKVGGLSPPVSCEAKDAGDHVPNEFDADKPDLSKPLAEDASGADRSENKDPTFIAAVKKTPKARKSFKTSTVKASDYHETKAPSLNSASCKIATSRANMTFKLTEVESALGIKRRSLSKIDSKTLDKIILEKAHQKRGNSMSPAKYHPSEKPGSDQAECIKAVKHHFLSGDPMLPSTTSGATLKRRYRRRRKIARNQWTRQKRRIHPVHRVPRVSYTSSVIDTRLEAGDEQMTGDDDGEGDDDDEDGEGDDENDFNTHSNRSFHSRDLPLVQDFVDKESAHSRKRKRMHRQNSENKYAKLEDDLPSLPLTSSPPHEDSLDLASPRGWSSSSRGRASLSNRGRGMSRRSRGGRRRQYSLTTQSSNGSPLKQMNRSCSETYVNTPNGLLYPVSPQRPLPTATNQIDLPTMIRKSISDSDSSPLCQCAVDGTTFPNYPRILYCQAIDTIDTKSVGCGSKVVNQQLFRPSSRVPFLALCSSHRQLLQEHKCCPTCGHFCAQGTFYRCGSGSSVEHHYHLDCVSVHGEKHKCPHCAQPATHALALLVQPHKARAPVFLNAITQPARRAGEGVAKMGSKVMKEASSVRLGEESLQVLLFNNDKLIYTLGVKSVPEKEMLTEALSVLDGEKGKKLRTTQKSLHAACKSGELERVLLMLREGVDVNQRCSNSQARTGVHGAAETGRCLIAHILIQAGADINVCDSDLYTPLMFTCQRGQHALISTLLQAGANPDSKNTEGMTALHLAAKAGDVTAMKSLLAHPLVDINVKDDGGWTPVIWAAEHQHLPTVQYLLEMGANPALRDNEDNTCLHWAAFSGSADIAEMFINSGCEVNICNEHGDTPLHVAARQNSYECVILLLLRGADSSARNNRNETPATVCPDTESATRLALEVNLRLRSMSFVRPPDKSPIHRLPLLFRDISYGREANCLPVVNQCDDESYPTDFTYVMENVETVPMNINRTISSLQTCNCGDRCGTVHCGCSRSSIQCWYDKEGRLIEGINLADPPLIFECNKGCRCWANCQNRVVQLGITSRLEVFRTKGRGWGCRATQEIRKGTFVCEYIGELISDAEADRREDDSYLFDLDNKDVDTFCVDARRYGNVARFINHLCQPNLVPIKVFVDHQDLRFPRICFFSSRDIMPGEELGFDYGEKFWVIKWKQFTCECSSPVCRFSKDTIHKTIEDYRRHLGDEEPVVVTNNTQP